MDANTFTERSISRTEWRVIDLTLLKKDGRFYEGRAVLTKSGKREVHDWTARYDGEERWKITERGALMSSGGRVPSAESYPFSLDPMVNSGLSEIIKNWLNTHRSMVPNATATTPATSVTPATAVAPPKPPVPAKPAPTAASAQNGNGHVKKYPGATYAGIPKEPDTLVYAAVDEIIPFLGDDVFSGQPRKEFDPQEQVNLAQSLKTDSQRQPLVVRRVNGIPGKKYELTAGERRWRGTQLVGITHVWVIVRWYPSKQAQYMDALIENLQRVTPNNSDLSDALQQQMNAGASAESLAPKISRSLNTVYKILSLQKIHPDLRRLLSPTMPSRQRLRLDEGAKLAAAPLDRQVEFWNIAKTQPTHGLIVRKLNELTAPYRTNRRVLRPDSRDESSTVSRRFNNLNGLILDLMAVQPREWTMFHKHKGPEKISQLLERLSAAQKEIEVISSRIRGEQAPISAGRLTGSKMPA